MPESSYRADIDGLRALAVVAVVLYHLGIERFGGGYVGVDVFFVISGFLITRLIRDEVVGSGGFSFSNFYIRRVRRLFAALLFTVAASFVAAIVLFSPQHLHRLGGSVLASLLSISNIYFWSESGYFDTSAEFKPLLHTWSLSVEEQFYMIWPVVLATLLSRRKKVSVPKFLGVVGVLSLGLNFAFSEYRSAIFFLTPFRLFEFAIGALMVWGVHHQPRDRRLLEPLLLLGLAMIAWSALLFDDDTLFPSYNALVPCLGTALVIHSGRARYTGRVLDNPLAVGIGLISYSLYLIHWPMIVFYRHYKFDSLEPIEKAVLAGVSVGAAALMYRYIEQPFRRGFRSPNAWPNRKLVMACVGTAMLVVLPASHVLLDRGWIWRLPEERAETYSDFAALGLDLFGGAGCRRERRCDTHPEREVFAFIVGESHARHYFSGLKSTFGDTNFKFMDVDCPIFFVRHCNNNRYANPKSFARAEAARSDLAAAEGHIIVSSVLVYSRRKGVTNMETNDVRRFEDDEEWFEFIRVNLQEFAARYPGRKILLMGETPRIGYSSSPLDCMGRPISRRRCDVVPKRELESLSGWNQRLAVIARDLGVFFVDPFESLCSADECIIIRDSEPLFSDSHHLSVAGSSLMAPVIGEKLSIRPSEGL